MCYNICHNPSLGLATKAKAWKGAGQECNPRTYDKNLAILKKTLHNLVN
jgi:hypothetical protein